MDGQSQLLPFNGNSHRRKLTKKPPPASHHHSSSLSIDGRIDAQSIQSKRSSTSLKRAPSAPPARTPTSNASNNSSPRYPPSQTANRSNPSPILPSNEFTGQHTFYAPQLQQHPALSIRGNRNSYSSPSNSHSRPLSSKTSEELIGAPFDGSSILNRIEATKSPTHYLPPPPRPAPAPPLVGADDAATRAMPPPPPPPLRQSASFTAADSKADTIVNSDDKSLSKVESNTVPPKRYSDEAKEAKPSAVLRKKSGFSGFMTSLVGSPKKPLISAPENPVHLTHVGYDSATGQFTVRSFILLSFLTLHVLSA